MTPRHLFGLLGNPVGHSLSPVMMNAAFAADGEAAVYLSFEVSNADIQTALEGLRSLGAQGVNITIPHKRAAYEWVSEKTAAAERVGVVNTVRFHPDGGLGHNTDVSGWWKSVADAVPEHKPRMALIGAGGAAMAILSAISLHRPHASVQVVARNEAAVLAIQKHFADVLSVTYIPWAHRQDTIACAEVVIQTTPIGMWPHQNTSPIDDDGVFSAGQVVQDIVYRPLSTRFLQLAQQRGAKIIDGASMLIYQGIDAYEWWLGRKAPADVMQKAIYESLRQEHDSR